MNNRRDFLKKAVLAGASALVAPTLLAAEAQGRVIWDTGDLSWEIEDNKYVIDEAWKMYGEKYKSFDRDIPIRFLPIKFDKLYMKLETAKRVEYDKVIIFEFSHFMSPQSAYLKAVH